MHVLFALQKQTADIQKQDFETENNLKLLS